MGSPPPGWVSSVAIRAFHWIAPGWCGCRNLCDTTLAWTPSLARSSRVPHTYVGQRFVERAGCRARLQRPARTRAWRSECPAPRWTDRGSHSPRACRSRAGQRGHSGGNVLVGGRVSSLSMGARSRRPLARILGPDLRELDGRSPRCASTSGCRNRCWNAGGNRSRQCMASAVVCALGGRGRNAEPRSRAGWHRGRSGVGIASAPATVQGCANRARRRGCHRRSDCLLAGSSVASTDIGPSHARIGCSAGRDPRVACYTSARMLGPTRPLNVGGALWPTRDRSDCNWRVAIAARGILAVPSERRVSAIGRNRWGCCGLLGR